MDNVALLDGDVNGDLLVGRNARSSNHAYIWTNKLFLFRINTDSFQVEKAQRNGIAKLYANYVYTITVK